MVFKRGQIFLANFNPSKGNEPGKIRPCLILQSDLLNDISHPTTTVIPLTTQLNEAVPLRYRINARSKLQHNSDLMLDQSRTIDNQRFIGDAIAELTAGELAQLNEYLQIVLGFQD